MIIVKAKSRRGGKRYIARDTKERANDYYECREQAGMKVHEPVARHYRSGGDGDIARKLPEGTPAAATVVKRG